MASGAFPRVSLAMEGTGGHGKEKLSMLGQNHAIAPGRDWFGGAASTGGSSQAPLSRHLRKAPIAGMVELDFVPAPRIQGADSRNAF